MSDSENRSSNIAPSMRESGSGEEKMERSAKKAPSLREETYKPADPNKPAPKTIILDDSAFIPKESMRDIAAHEMKNRRDQNVSSSFRDLENEAINSRNMDRFKEAFENSDDDDSYSDNDSYNEFEEDFDRDDEDVYDETDQDEDQPREKGENILSSFSKLRSHLTAPDNKKKKKSGGILDKLNSIPLIRQYGKKILATVIALIIIIILIVLIFGGSSFKNVGAISIDSTASTQTLTWSGSVRGMTYEVYRTNETTGETKLVDTLTGGENTITYDGLDAGTPYSYTIITVNKNGEKTEGTTAEAYTKPNCITNPSAVTTKENSLTVSWSLSGAASGYELKYGTYDNLRDAITISLSSDLVTDNGDGTYSCLVDNLVLGTTYYFSMRTLCGENSSEWCTVFSGTVSEPSAIADLDSDQPMVALTFDGGPDGNGVTERILNILSEYNSHATFFQTGVNAETYPDLMQRIVNEGHEVGNHTYDESHVGGEVTADDITLANDAILAACGVSPTLFRAPQGEVTDAIRNACTDNGMSIILWNFDSHDWEYYDPQEIIDRVETYVEDGDIIQFRNTYDETATAIETLVPYLIDQGYQLVTVSQLIEAKTGSAPQAGVLYSSGYESE